VVNILGYQKSNRFKFKWNHYGKFRDKKYLSFEEMLQEYLKEAQETQKAIKLKALKRNRGR
jgi:hypothetical protein